MASIETMLWKTNLENQDTEQENQDLLVTEKDGQAGCVSVCTQTMPVLCLLSCVIINCSPSHFQNCPGLDIHCWSPKYGG